MPRLLRLFVLSFFACVSALAAESTPLAKLRSGHPRLLLTNEYITSAVAAAQTDPLRAALHTRIVEVATRQLSEKSIVHELVGPRLLDQSRAAISRVATGAIAYRLTGDERFADRAKREMLTAAAFPDWNPSHFLDVAEMSTALALGYDWLYDYLSSEDRATIRTALVQKGLSFAAIAYNGGRAADKRLWFAEVDHNWNQVCNGGLLLAALALADEEPTIAQTVLDGARRTLPRAMRSYEPDGAYPEGPGYWTYGTTYNVLLLAALDSALGTDSGLGSAPAFDLTTLYRLYIQSPAGPSFNYADGGADMDASPAYTWLAKRYQQPAALAHSRELLAQALKDKKTSDRFFALNALWFPEAVDPAATAALPLDRAFSGPAQIALFRSAWSDPRALFVGFKAGSNAVNHSHLDLGSFVLDADGVRWSHEFGRDDYNLPAYFSAKRWTYFRLNNHGHSTLTPGTALQAPKANAPMIAFTSTPARAFAVADLSEAYPDAAKKFLRGIALLDRSRVLVQDEVTALQAGTPLFWRFITQASITVETPHVATLNQNGRRLRVEILEPAEARFTARPATPPTAAERQNKEFTLLEAEVPAAPTLSDNRIIVLITPLGDHWPAPTAAPAVTPLTAW